MEKHINFRNQIKVKDQEFYFLEKSCVYEEARTNCTIIEG